MALPSTPAAETPPAAPLVETVQTVAPPPDTGGIGMYAPITVRTRTDPAAEYLVAGGWPWLRALPRYVDDLTRDFGTDLYWRMVRDPVLQSALRLVVLAALAPPLGITPAVAGQAVDAKHPEYAQAQKMAEHTEAQIARLDRPVKALLAEMGFEALATGKATGEQLFEPAEVTPGAGPQRALRAIRPKPPESYAYIVTPTNDLLGVMYSLPGQPVVTPTVVLPLPDGTIPRFLPRSFLLHLAWQPLHDDPRGTSHLRPAYLGWWLKQQAIPEYLKWVSTFASPSLAAAAAEGSIPDADGTTPEAKVLAALMQLRNGAAGAFPPGTQLPKVIEATGPAGTGGPFLGFFTWCDHQMTQGVLYQVRATLEAQHGSKADSETGENLLDLLTGGVGDWLTDSFTRDVIRPLLATNFGPGAVRYTPLVGLSSTTPANQTDLMIAVATMQRYGYLHSSMYPALDAAIGFGGVRDLKAQLAEAEAQQAQVAAAQAAQAQAAQASADDTDSADTPPGKQPPPGPAKADAPPKPGAATPPKKETPA